MRRLSYVRQLQALPASVQFDLARSPISDDELDEFATAYGVPPKQGFGIADVAHELLSAQPRSIPVRDLIDLQNNLRDQGYLPPTYVATGVWDDLSYSAFKRADRDATDLMRSGKGFLSGALEAGVRTLTATLPSFIWQNTVGAAKGIVQETPGFLERGGAIGGVATGATVGGLIGGPPGALIGGIGGGIIGFAADFFGGDEAEPEDRSGWSNFVDALSPWTEYQDNPRAVFEDLSYVATAATLVSGAKLVKGGVEGAFGLARGTQAAAAEAAALEAGAITMPRLQALPGGVARMVSPPAPVSTAIPSLGKSLLTPAAEAGGGGLLRGALSHPVVTGAVAGGFIGLGGAAAGPPPGAIDNGDGTWTLETGQVVEAPDPVGFGDLLEGALWGAGIGFVFRGTVKVIPGGDRYVSKLRSLMDKHAISQRPVFQLANKTYSGLARTSVGVRITAGLGGPEEYETPLERAIRTTERLETGVDILGQDLLDWSAAILYPEKFFPWRGRELAASADRLLGNSELIRPIVHVAQYGSKMSLGRAAAWVGDFFGDRPDWLTKLWVDGAIDMEVARRLNLAGVSEKTQLPRFRSMKASIIRQIKDETETSGRSDLAVDLLARSRKDPEAFEGWLVENLEPGRPLNVSLQNYLEAQEHLVLAEAQLRREGTLVAEAPSGWKYTTAEPGGTYRARAPKVVISPGATRSGVDPSAAAQLRKTATDIEKEIKSIDRIVNRAPDDFIITQNAARRDILRAELKTVRDRIDELTGTGTTRLRTLEEIHFTPARMDTPTRRDFADANRSYKAVKGELRNALKAAKKAAPEDQAAALRIASAKKMEFEALTWELQRRELITSSAGAAARNTNGKGEIIENALEIRGAIAARDVDLDPATMSFLAERGYKPIVTGDEVFFPHDMQLIGDLLEVPKFSKFRNAFESITGGFRWTREDSLAGITWAYTKSQLDYTLLKHEIPLTGRQALTLLQKHLREVNSSAHIEDAGIARPLATVMSALRFKADVRRLRPDQVETALMGVPGITSPVADDIFRALKRGAAFGGELHVVHPIQSAQLLARAVRTAGLPGASQVIRSWHAKDFTRTLRGDVLKQPDLVYNPITSGERGRVVGEMRTAAATRGFSATEVREAERLLDVMADAAVRSDPGRYPSIDDFFNRLTVRATDDYVAGASQLRQTMWAEKRPTMNRLISLARRFEDARNWYQDATSVLAEVFSFGTTTLRNGRKINDFELMKNLVAATSPLKAPTENMQEALQILLAYKNSSGMSGLKPNVRTMVEEILDGHTIDKWEGAARPKVRAFYQNLTGAADHVTVDTWMYRLFGRSDTPTNHAYITERITEVATRLGWEPVQAQAALWGGFKDEAASIMAKAERPAHEVARVRKADSFADVVKIPKIQALIETYGDSLGYRLLQQVEDTVRGSIAFGDDYRVVISLYRTADFGTLVHEAGHLMRRIVPEDVARRIEARYGVSPGPTVFAEKPLIDAGPHLDEMVSRTLDLATPGRGGSTFNPHTGEFVEGEGYAVAMNFGTSATIRSDAPTDEIKGAIRSFIDDNADALKSERAHVGTWNDREGMIHLDLSEILMSRSEAVRLGAERGQEAVFDLKALEDVRIPDEARQAAPVWPESAEEAFTNDFSAYVGGKLRGDAGPLHHLREAVSTLWGRNREALFEKGLISPGVRNHFDALFDESMRKAGLVRPRPTAYKQVVAGAAVGATEGAVSGDSLEDILRGAAIGAGVGLGLRPALKATYGYLPDALTNLNLALRYSLSFTFDLGRYIEQNMIAAEKYGLEMFLSPKKYVRNSEWKSPYAPGTVRGDEAWEHVHRFFDELNGVDYFARIAESEQRMFQQGMLGFSPRNFEAVQAWQMYQLGWGRDKIYEAVAQLGRYGLGRTNAERSANFIFFPFSFSKKLLMTLGDFIGQAPARNLLIVEGLRRYHESIVDEQFHDFVEDRAPILDQLWRVNNLAWGMSLGRFFLEGIDDRRTNVGRVQQILASFFVPSGSATPMQQAIGALGDLSVNLFTPVVVTGESISRSGGIDGFDDILARYIPVVREIDSFWQSFMDQKVALVSPSHRTPWSQFQEYSEQKRALKDSYAPISAAMGYATVDGLFQSDLGTPLKSQYDSDVDELRREYPQGWEITTGFENQAAIDEAGLIDLARKIEKTESEEAFLQLIQNVQALQSLASWMPEEVARVIEQGTVREFALKWANDRRFAELYHRFLERLYGPIRMVG